LGSSSKGECHPERRLQRATRARKALRHDTTRTMQATTQFCPTRIPSWGKVHRCPRQQLVGGLPHRVASVNLIHPKPLGSRQLLHRVLSHHLVSPKEPSHHHEHALSTADFFLFPLVSLSSWPGWLPSMNDTPRTHFSF
jgi:hypothetical protein